MLGSQATGDYGKGHEGREAGRRDCRGRQALPSAFFTYALRVKVPHATSFAQAVPSQATIQASAKFRIHSGDVTDG